MWALGGFFLSLGPSLVREVSGLGSSLVGGALVATLTLSGALAIYRLRLRPAQQVLALGTGLLAGGVGLILLALHNASLVLFFAATLVAGSGFGAGFLGALRSTCHWPRPMNGRA